MGPFQVVISGIVNIVVYSLILAGVFKLFQIATNLSEIKDLLQDVRRNTQDLTFPEPTGTQNLLAAVRAESEATPSLVPAAIDREI